MTATSSLTIARRLALPSFLIALLISALPLAADTYPRQPGIKIANYQFEVTLTDASDSISMNEQVTVDFLQSGLTGFDLDLCNYNAAPRPRNGANGFPDPCAEPGGGRGAAPTTPKGGLGMTVTAVSANGQPLRYSHENDKLHIDFPSPSTSGSSLTIALSYHGIPADGLRIGNNKYGDREFFTNPWPDHSRNWLAVIDHPSMKAPKTLAVIAPRHYQVISNGTLMESTDLPNDQRRTVWKESVPICTWQYSLGAAPFAVDYFGIFDSIPMSAWVFPQERDKSFAAFSKFTQPILQFYIQNIGPFSYEKLAQVEANTVGGGMELASDIYYGYNEDTIGDVGGRQLLAHEMAHQWFGDSATEKDWDDVWLSEGFATYFALLYQEHADGHDAMTDALKTTRDQVLRYELANPDSTIVHNNLADISKVIANNAQIYQGGAWVLQMTRGLLGESTFWNGIRLYYSRFRNSNSTDADLRQAFEDACDADGDTCALKKNTGSSDLTWFFHEFLNRGGILEVSGTWHYDPAAKQLTVTLDQKQPGDPYRMLIPLGITTAAPEFGRGGRGRGGRGGRGGRAGANGEQAATPPPPPPAYSGPPLPTVERDEVLDLQQAHQVFTFPMDTAPLGVTLDPHTQVLMQFELTGQ